MVKGAGAGTTRRPRQTAKKTPQERESPVGAGHNGMTDEEHEKAMQALAIQAAQQIEAKQRIQAQALADIRNIRKRAKAEGVKPARLNFLLEIRKDAQGTTEKYQQLVNDLQTAAAWGSHELKHQGVLFGEEDRTPIEDRAFEQGKQAGLAGEGCVVPPNYAGTPAGNKWTAGWQDGQEILATKGFKQLDEAHVEAKVTRGAAKPSAPAADADEDDERVVRPAFGRRETDPTETIN